MKKTIVAALTVAAIAGSLVTATKGVFPPRGREKEIKKFFFPPPGVGAPPGRWGPPPPPAQAHDGVGVGIAAGLLGGAISGGAIASSRPAYGGPFYVADPGPP